jgi:beta-glucuronidase
MHAWIKRLALVLALVVALACVLVVALFKAYPTVKYAVPLPGTPAGYEVRSIDGIPFLVEGSLPYPTDFDAVTYPSQDLGGAWKMRLDENEVGEAEGWEKLTAPDDSWTDTTVPSTYNSYDGPYSKHAGVVWFVKTFVPKRTTTSREFARLSFAGVLLRSRVWLNGTYVGEHEGGYTPFYFDVTDKLIPGKPNVLVVRTDNRLTFESLPAKSWKGHTPGWGYYGGIYRDVTLQSVPRTYICKAAVTPETRGDEGVVAVDLVVHSRGDLETYTVSGSLTAPDGRRYAIPARVRGPAGEYDGCRLVVDVPRPSPWSPESPALYTLALTLGCRGTSETVTTKIGFRTVEAAADGLFLNGDPLFLRGISKHEDDPKLGATLTPAIIDRDLDLIQDMGANFIRLAHYPHDVRELHACRDRGIMVSEEIPFYKLGIGWAEWYQEKKGLLEFPVGTFGMRQLNDMKLMSIAERQLIEMVERDRNNPAVIMWLVANETYTLFKEGGAYHGWMRDVVRYFDATRPVTMAEQTYDKPFLDDHRRSADYMDVVSLNTYFGWYYGTYEGLYAHLGHFHTLFPDKPIFLTEFGAEAGPGRHDSDGVWIGDRVRPGKTYSEEYQDKVIRGYVRIATEKKYVVGVCPWVFADFWDPWFPSNPVPDYNTKGVVSRDRVPKESYYSLKELYTAIRDGKEIERMP